MGKVIEIKRPTEELAFLIWFGCVIAVLVLGSIMSINTSNHIDTAKEHNREYTAEKKEKIEKEYQRMKAYYSQD